MGNHELSPLDAICVAPVYTAAWAQEHASSETCLMASSYRKSVHYSGWFVGSIFHAVACYLDSVHYPLRIWLWSGLLRYNIFWFVWGNPCSNLERFLILAGEMLIIWGVPTQKLLTLPAFRSFFDSHRGNVNNLGGPNPKIINITSVSFIFWFPQGKC